MDKLHEIRREIESIAKRPNLTYEAIKQLSELHGAECALMSLDPQKTETAYTAEPQRENTQKELTDVFPALELYQKEHTANNLQRLCTEVLEFCTAIYASTENPQERAIYFNMVEKMKK